VDPWPAPITDIAGWQVLRESYILVVAVAPASPPILALRRAGPKGQGNEMPVIAVYMEGYSGPGMLCGVYLAPAACRCKMMACSRKD
jgi:hypothetical protein